MSRKYFLISSIILIALTLMVWAGWRYWWSTTPVVLKAIESVHNSNANLPTKNSGQTYPLSLNLKLPEERFLMDPVISLPEKEDSLNTLFKRSTAEKNVKLGGSVIMEEKPADPNAAIWDQVKGAEVEITIKTP